MHYQCKHEEDKISYNLDSGLAPKTPDAHARDIGISFPWLASVSLKKIISSKCTTVMSWITEEKMHSLILQCFCDARQGSIISWIYLQAILTNLFLLANTSYMNLSGGQCIYVVQSIRRGKFIYCLIQYDEVSNPNIKVVRVSRQLV